MRRREIIKGRIEGSIRCEAFLHSRNPWHVPMYDMDMGLTNPNYNRTTCRRCFHPLQLEALDYPEDGVAWRTSTHLIREWP